MRSYGTGPTRYERELNRVERPILRKVLEGDAVSSRLMVLFVADIHDAHVAPKTALMVEVGLTNVIIS